MGRPKGSKNKVKTIMRTPESVAKDVSGSTADPYEAGAKPYTEVTYQNRDGTQTAHFPMEEKEDRIPTIKWFLLGALAFGLLVAFVKFFSK